ncbi:MAG: hypothetical protein R3268_12165 [Acidiferrobacterales bacterium]|nr:hypothetical protein [Acidiferrobacterales bacterium]
MPMRPLRDARVMSHACTHTAETKSAADVDIETRRHRQATYPTDAHDLVSKGTQNQRVGTRTRAYIVPTHPFRASAAELYFMQHN